MSKPNQFEAVLVNKALKAYSEVYAVGQSRGWMDRAWINKTILSKLDVSDQEFLWKQVNLNGPLLSGEIQGTVFKIQSSDVAQRKIRFTELDFKDFYKNVIYVNQKRFSFAAFGSLENLYKNQLLKELKNHNLADNFNVFEIWQEWLARHLLVQKAYAIGCSKDDVKTVATTGLAAASIAHKVTNPVMFCADLAFDTGHAAYIASTSPTGQKTETFKKVLKDGILWEYNEIKEGVSYCQYRSKALKPSDAAGDSLHL